MVRAVRDPVAVARIEMASPASNFCELESSHVLEPFPVAVHEMPALLGPVAPAGSLRTVNVYLLPGPGAPVRKTRRLLTVPPVGSTSWIAVSELVNMSIEGPKYRLPIFSLTSENPPPPRISRAAADPAGPASP